MRLPLCERNTFSSGGGEEREREEISEFEGLTFGAILNQWAPSDKKRFSPLSVSGLRRRSARAYPGYNLVVVVVVVDVVATLKVDDDEAVEVDLFKSMFPMNRPNFDPLSDAGSVGGSVTTERWFDRCSSSSFLSSFSDIGSRDDREGDM